jgi:hypothetical protein
MGQAFSEYFRFFSVSIISPVLLSSILLISHRRYIIGAIYIVVK